MSRLFVGLLAAALLWPPCTLSADLAEAFHTPPPSARPWVFWFWMNGNVTREGITADLEAMRRVGIGGVLIMNVEVFQPKGPVSFMSAEWRAMFQHALKEASRLGIDVAMNNDDGWAGSGGPWVKPEQAMQMLVWSETRVAGPRRFAGDLAKPKTVAGFYRDIAVLAFPTPQADAVRMLDARPVVTLRGGAKLDLNKLADGNAATVETLPASSEPNVVTIEFPRPFAARALSMALDTYPTSVRCVLEASGDGRVYRRVREFTAKWPVTSASFPLIQATHFRIRLSPAALMLGELELTGGERIEGIAGKAAYIGDAYPVGASGADAGVVARSSVIDLTSKLDDWEVPAGNWTVLRIGHTPTGVRNNSSTDGGRGLESDKLNASAVEAHFGEVLGKLVTDQRAAGATSLKYAHIDSWEAASQNWTGRMREEFRQRNGYDLLPFLPVITGRAVESGAHAERFLWDLRRTIADLMVDRYATTMRELSHRHGLRLSMEPFGAGPVDPLLYASKGDLLLSEFWLGYEPWWVVKEVASAAHTYGHSVSASEAFTSRSAAGKWQAHPFRMKPLGDRMFASGVNHFVFHRYAMQPWTNRYPGMTMGPYGIEFDRNVTWWEQGKAYLQYLARCQHLLQQGTAVADIGYLSPEKTPQNFQAPPPLNPAPPLGYDYDLISVELQRKLEVRDGVAVLPSAMSYRVLVLPAGNTMRVAQMRHVRELVEAGAIVVGPPPTGSPSLAEMGAGDREVQRMAHELWGGLDGLHQTERAVGRGRIVWGKALSDVLFDLGVEPDFTTLGDKVHYAHRVVGAKDVYFLASGESEAATFLCTFRVAGKTPEFWWPDSGRIERAAVYEHQGASTRMPVRLDPYGSVFVVFDRAAGVDPVVRVTRDGVDESGLRATAVSDLRGKLATFRVIGTAGGYRLEASRAGAYELRTASGKSMQATIASVPEPLEIGGPWELTFPKGWGAPERVVLDRLTSWTAHSDDGVRHFSGTAVYRKRLDVPEAMVGRTLYLDLGHVAVMAEVSLNGRELGIVWKPPYRVDVTSAIRAGANDLEIRVVNLWANRLIGDERLADDAEWEGSRIKSWPQWLLDGRPSPAGRVTFASWKHWHKNDALLESGLIGPVRLEATETVEIPR